MDVTASLVSLIQFTVKGIQTIHKIATSIQEGPDTVLQVARYASDLLHILQRLEKSPAAAQSQETKFLESLKACNTDVTSMIDKLARAGFKPDDNLGIKIWKSVKSAVKEKEWKLFQTRLQEYLGTMNMFVDLENREKLFDMSQKMNVGQESIQDAIRSLMAKCEGIETRCAQIESTASSAQLQIQFDVLRDIQGQLRLLASHQENLVGRIDVGMEALPRLAHNDVADDIKLLHQDVKKLIAETTVTTTVKRKSWTLAEVLRNSNYLESFFSKESTRPLWTSSTKPARLNPRALSRLKQWSQPESGSQILWLKGQYTPERGTEHPLTRIGMSLVELAAQSNIPMVSYFCQPGQRATKQQQQELDEIPEAEVMTSMLYAYLYQMLRHLPAQFEAGDIDLSEARFQRLDGTRASWEAALGVLGDIIPLFEQKTVYCVLDGVVWLEHASTVACLKAFLETLRQVGAGEGGGGVKVLFITSGLSRVLRDTLAREDTLAEEELGGVGRHGEDLQRYGQRLWEGGTIAGTAPQHHAPMSASRPLRLT